jgi:hypothetical protein
LCKHRVDPRPLPLCTHLLGRWIEVTDRVYAKPGRIPNLIALNQPGGSVSPVGAVGSINSTCCTFHSGKSLHRCI